MYLISVQSWAVYVHAVLQDGASHNQFQKLPNELLSSFVFLLSGNNHAIEFHWYKY